MGKSQETLQLAVGRNGKRGFGDGSPHYGFFLGISPGHIARTSSRNKMKNFCFEAGEIHSGNLPQVKLFNPTLVSTSQPAVGFRLTLSRLPESKFIQ